jgi:hypothetical protein
VIYRMNAAGEKLDCVRIDNELMRFAEEVAKAPAGVLRPGTENLA